MKLSDFYSRSIKDAMEAMKMVNLKINADICGNVRSICVKFSNESEEENKNNERNGEQHEKSEKQAD